jgi:hypothetical protein
VIAHIVADKCIEHLRNGSFVFVKLWNSVARCRGPALRDTLKILNSRNDDDTTRHLMAVLDNFDRTLSEMPNGAYKAQFQQEVQTVADAYYDRFPILA